MHAPLDTFLLISFSGGRVGFFVLLLKLAINPDPYHSRTHNGGLIFSSDGKLTPALSSAGNSPLTGKKID